VKISAFDIRAGILIEYQGRLWRVLKCQHVKPGKGPAYMQVEMKELSAGTKRNERLRSADTVERAQVEGRTMQYLYPEGDGLVFMDTGNYEQLTLRREDIEDQAGYLIPETEVRVNFYNEIPIGLDLPATVVLTVRETETTIKGQTAAGGGKPAILETGLRVTVPTFVTAGERIKVNTETGEYVERAA
jgi:elongation factor P